MQPHHFQVFRLRILAIILGFILIIVGSVFAYLEIRAGGSISLKTPFLEGSVTGAHFGLFLAFCGLIVMLVALLKTQTVKSSITSTNSNTTKSKQFYRELSQLQLLLKEGKFKQAGELVERSSVLTSDDWKREFNQTIKHQSDQGMLAGK